jgi:hypothetical protein
MKTYTVIYRNETLQKERESAWERIKQEAAKNEAIIHSNQGKCYII